MQNNKAKAEEIVNRFKPYAKPRYWEVPFGFNHAKQCALIHVDGVIEALTNLYDDFSKNVFPKSIKINSHIEEYKAIREEILKM